ncbi:lysozyme-like domain-containing protein [Mycena maculata]|uniref:Lysozyme-like domain-containing protein n=1 Tax=Mycena maculata TaxID=230809 RepID=A0AAD7NLU7_9AGAR|nr:lysozyme-like domain-containing protein [Mycena maculata]
MYFLLAARGPQQASNVVARHCVVSGLDAQCILRGDLILPATDFIKDFEGFVACPAPDPIGLPTVGYGHLCKSNECSEVPFSFPLSPDTASQLLEQDLKPFVSCVHKAVSDSIALTDNQVVALLSLAYNIEEKSFKVSTLELNTVAAEEIPRFSGKELPGLVRRRAAEVELFQTLSDVNAHGGEQPH